MTFHFIKYDEVNFQQRLVHVLTYSYSCTHITAVSVNLMVNIPPVI